MKFKEVIDMNNKKLTKNQISGIAVIESLKQLGYTEKYILDVLITWKKFDGVIKEIKELEKKGKLFYD